MTLGNNTSSARHQEELLKLAGDPKATEKRLEVIKAATRERNEAEAQARQALADLRAARAELEERRAELIAEERAAFEAEKAAYRERVQRAIAPLKEPQND